MNDQRAPVREVGFREDLAADWLTRAAAVRDGAVIPAAGEESQLPPIGYFWGAGDAGGAPAVTEQLIGQAIAAGVLCVPPGVSVVLEHRPSRTPGDGGTYRVLAEIAVPGREVPLALATTARRWCLIGGAGVMGPQAAASILREVARAASSLLAALAAVQAPQFAY